MFLLERTRFGARVRAAVDNQRMARGLGIDVDRAFMVTFALGGGLAGLGGALAIQVVGLDPTFALAYLVYVLIVVAVGGLGSIGGSFAAAVVLGISDMAGKYYFPWLGAFLIYLVMVALLMWRPRACLESANAHFQQKVRWHPLEIVFWLCTLLPFVVTPNYLSLASQIAITALFALSLDLILGYAGIVSLGHAAFFGVGAYTAGLLAKHYWAEPLTGFCSQEFLPALWATPRSHIMVRFRHLALIMLTMGLGLLLHEAANSASALTGGADGLQGFKVPSVLGFKFDMFGRTAYAYSLADPLRLLSGLPEGSFIRPSAWRCAASARTRPACRRSARRAARTCARPTPSPR